MFFNLQLTYEIVQNLLQQVLFYNVEHTFQLTEQQDTMLINNRLIRCKPWPRACRHGNTNSTVQQQLSEVKKFHAHCSWWRTKSWDELTGFLLTQCSYFKAFSLGACWQSRKEELLVLSCFVTSSYLGWLVVKTRAGWLHSFLKYCNAWQNQRKTEFSQELFHAHFQ